MIGRVEFVQFVVREVLDELPGEFLFDVDGHGKIWIPMKEIHYFDEYPRKGDKNVLLAISERYADKANLASGKVQ